MYRVRQEDLPFEGSSHQEFEAGAGDILIIKAGEIHGFRCIGEGPLVQVDVHLSPHFIQENLT